MDSSVIIEEGWVQLGEAGKQTDLAPLLTEGQRNRSVGFQILMAKFGEVISPKDAQGVVIALDAQLKEETINMKDDPNKNSSNSDKASKEK